MEMLSEIDRYVLDSMTSGSNHPVSNRQNAIAIRVYGDEAKKLILAKRAEWRKGVLHTQQNWRTRVSRRAQRNVHHDSWAIRENYVRQGGGYADYYSLGHALIRQAIANGARTNIRPEEMRFVRRF